MLISKLTLGRQEGGQVPTPGSPLPQHPSSQGIISISSLRGGAFLGARDVEGEALEGRRGCTGTSLLRAERQGKDELVGSQVGG